MALYIRGIKSTIGPLTLTADDNALLAIEFKTSPRNDKSEILDTASLQLAEYFQGKRKEFSIPLNPNGTEYQNKCWSALLSIPYGKTVSYKEQAITVAGVTHTRAVAGANNKNPIPIVIPCHRVIGINGALVGYAGGLKVKEKLLKLEQDAH